MTAIDVLLAPLAGRFTQADIARAAEIHPTHLANLLAGRKVPQPGTLARIRLGIARLKARQQDTPLDVVATYRVVLALACHALAVDPAKAQVSVPRHKQTMNPDWMAAAKARRLAVYLMNTTLGFRQVMVARAAGVTKQAINQLVRDVEDMREATSFDATVKELEGWILGEAE